MFKFFILICLMFYSFQAKSYESFDSFDEALNYEKSIYDFDRNFEFDLKHFENFKTKYDKIYATQEEEAKRFEIFRINKLKIKLFNALDYGSAMYGVNLFADLNENEFRAKYTGLIFDKKQMGYEIKFEKAEFDRDAELPKEIDWREKGAVTEVKDQKTCGSCWAFSAVASIESQNQIVNGELISLSEQELVDCDKQSKGCSGGFMSWAFESLIKIGGVETETEYPYKGFNEVCAYKKNLTRVQIKSYVNLTRNEDDIAQYVAQKGPVSIGINANLMQFYLGGISHPTSFLERWICSPTSINHGVVIVGFGETTRRGKPEPYWIIKNSWTKNWGREGYYYLYRGSNACGVKELASAPIVVPKKS